VPAAGLREEGSAVRCCDLVHRSMESITTVSPRMYLVGGEHGLRGAVPLGLDGGCKMREPIYIPSWGSPEGLNGFYTLK
jgi:hypothetical protein